MSEDHHPFPAQTLQKLTKSCRIRWWILFLRLGIGIFLEFSTMAKMIGWKDLVWSEIMIYDLILSAQRNLVESAIEHS